MKHIWVDSICSDKINNHINKDIKYLYIKIHANIILFINKKICKSTRPHCNAIQPMIHVYLSSFGTVSKMITWKRYRDIHNFFHKCNRHAYHARKSDPSLGKTGILYVHKYCLIQIWLRLCLMLVLLNDNCHMSENNILYDSNKQGSLVLRRTS